jgi:branched-chain amino acid transport system permease protein
VENLLRLTYGPRLQQIPAVFTGNTVVRGISITHQGVLVSVVAITSLFALHTFLKSSRHGLSIRAVSEQQDAAKLMGIPVLRVFLIVMIVSAAMAGLAGILLSSMLSLTPFAGFLPLLKALIVTIFGGLGSVKGTIVGAYVIGLLEASTQVFLGVGWSLPVLFLFIILVLVLRPEGLYGEKALLRL